MSSTRLAIKAGLCRTEGRYSSKAEDEERCRLLKPVGAAAEIAKGLASDGQVKSEGRDSR